VLIRDDRIAFVGDLAAAKAKAAKGARDIDLKGAAAFPGFVDAHAHLTYIGLRELTLNLDQIGSVEALVAAVKAYAAAHPDGPISGRGWIETHWPEKRFPNRADLDRAAPGRVVVLYRADGHAAVASTAALAAAKVTKDTVAPAGGQILKGQDGAPDGMLIDHAQSLVDSVIPPPSDALKRQALEKAGALYASRGWTGLGNMSVQGADLAILKTLAADRKFSLRVDNYMDPDSAAEVLAKGPSTDPTGLIRVRGIKLYMDGALGSRGAALLEPYSDAEGLGLQLTPRDTGLALMKQAKAAGPRSPCTPSATAATAWPWTGSRNAWAGTPRPAGGSSTRRSSPTPTCRASPSWASSPRCSPATPSATSISPPPAWARPAARGLSLEGLPRQRRGGRGRLGRPGRGRRPAHRVLRRRLPPQPDGFANADWHLEEAVSRQQALKMLTWVPAYAAFAEGSRGTLEAGKKADVTVFSQGPDDGRPGGDPDGRAVLTVVDGKVVFER
jgi:predicted amidohydrolase YtcJ